MKIVGQLYNYSNYHNIYFNRTKIKIINCHRRKQKNGQMPSIYRADESRVESPLMQGLNWLMLGRLFGLIKADNCGG
jgi:hypothetical protein